MLFSDWNRSGQASLRVSNDREYYQGGQEQLWKVAPGAPATLYTEQDGWKRLQVWGMGIAGHDIDGDGYPEYFITSMADNKFQKLEAGPGKPSYIDQAYKRGYHGTPSLCGRRFPPQHSVACPVCGRRQ